MTRAPTHATAAGRNYLALQRLAREQGRATDELLQLFALESFLDRLSSSDKPRDFVLKGGVLLAAYGLRRPTLGARFLKSSATTHKPESRTPEFASNPPPAARAAGDWQP